MLPAKLLYNPAAGRHRTSRMRLVQQVTSVLFAQGFAVESEATYARGSGARQAAEAVQSGAAVVFACGGDGTVHDVLQGVAGTDALLGIIPSGSANALAQELKLSRDPVCAAQSLDPEHSIELRTSVIRRANLPDLHSLCMAGAGPDGLLMYRMLTVNRAGLGRWRYYEHALRIFFSQQFKPFRVELQYPDGSQAQSEVVSAMALRIGDLQGVFRGIARGACIQDQLLHVILVGRPASLTLPLWLLLSWFGLERFHPGVSVSKALTLKTHETAPLQVDGEWAGRAVAEISIDGPLQRVLIPKTALFTSRNITGNFAGGIKRPLV